MRSALGSLTRDTFGRSVEGARRLVEQRWLADHHLVRAVRNDQEPCIGQLTVQRSGVIDGHEDVAITVDQEDRHPCPAQLFWREQRLVRHVGGDGAEKTLPRSRALHRRMSLLESRSPLGLVPLDALGIHEPRRDAGARLTLHIDATDDRGAEPLGMTSREGQRRHRPHREAAEVERLETQGVNEAEQVLHQDVFVETLLRVPLRAAMAARVHEIQAERAAEERALGRPILERRGCGAVEHHERRACPFGGVRDVDAVDVDGALKRRSLGHVASGLPRSSSVSACSMRR